MSNNLYMTRTNLKYIKDFYYRDHLKRFLNNIIILNLLVIFAIKFCRKLISFANECLRTSVKKFLNKKFVLEIHDFICLDNDYTIF